MIETIFYFVLNMSISGALVIAVMLLVRKINRIPKQILFVFWSVPWLRLIIPAFFSGPWSLFSLVRRFILKLIPIAQVGTVEIAAMNYINQASNYQPMEYKSQRMAEVFGSLSMIWVAGMGIGMVLLLLLYWRTHQKVGRCRQTKDGYYQAGTWDVPMTTGIFHPKILIPEGLEKEPEQLLCVMAHEKAHIQRKDNLWRLLALVTLCVHWFNPLVWFGLAYFLKDMELACDEAALRGASPPFRAAYAAVLLQMAGERTVPTGAPFGSTSRQRIKAVLNHHRITLFGTLAGVLFLLCMAMMLLSNPK